MVVGFDFVENFVGANCVNCVGFVVNFVSFADFVVVKFVNFVDFVAVNVDNKVPLVVEFVGLLGSSEKVLALIVVLKRNLWGWSRMGAERRVVGEGFVGE